MGGVSIRLLPILILALALVFGVRFGDFIRDLSASEKGNISVSQEEILAQTLAKTEPAAADKKEEEPPPKVEIPEGNLEILGNPPDAEWTDSLDSELEYSDAQIELFQDLSERRKLLEKREKELRVREALLQAAEQELDQKFAEMTALRNSIEELLKQQSEEEQKRIKSLVKIYEGMKAKDAARIFNTLDMDVLLEVMGQMSERKSAPILAAMNAERARSVTILLMEKKQLPDLSDNLVR